MIEMTIPLLLLPLLHPPDTPPQPRMQHTRNTLFARVDALAAQVDRLRARAEDLERGLGAAEGEGEGQGEGQDAGGAGGKAVKKGSGCAEMHGTREERRAARLAGIGGGASGQGRWRRSRSRGSEDETVPLLAATEATTTAVRMRMGRAGNPFLVAARADPAPALAPIERPTLAQVIARSNARIHRQIANLEAAETTQRTRRSRLDGDGQQRTGWVASPEPIGDVVAGAEESMTLRGRIVVDRSRAGLVTPPPPPPPPPPRRGSPVDVTTAAAASSPGPRPQSQVVPVDADEFPTPAEARSGGGDGSHGHGHGSLTSRVHSLAQSATILESPPPLADDTSGDDATMAELRLLQNTVTRLNDRLEVARANMAMLASARSSLREHEQNVERITAAAAAADGRFPLSASRAGSDPVQTLARRPSFPYPRDARHPHHRARIPGNPPIALVINMDNANSFDVNFDGTIVFRPISSGGGRACPDRELIARCLSMLPGGRDGTPSRWMRLTGAAGSRPRRAGTSAGYWVRWVAQDDAASASASATEGLHRRSLDMTRLPGIIAFDFAVSPPDDDGWVRADEIEFITPRTRLRATLGPWMHSRVRVEPFENDPPAAAWGTSAHVRQAVHEVGGLAMGHYMRYDFRERRVQAFAPGQRHPSTSAAAATSSSLSSSSSTSRAVLERVLDASEDTNPLTDTVPSTPLGAHIGETDDPENAWLMSYEPAIGQIRASWRAHYRRTRDEDPGAGAAGGLGGESGSLGGTPRNELWSRDYLDENGVPLPALPVDQAVIQSTVPPPSTNTPRAASSITTASGRITYV